MKNSVCKLVLVALVVFALTNEVRAEDPVPAHLTIANHAFDPQELVVPAGKKVKVTVTNKDDSAAEFESDDLGREKVVPAKGEIYVYIGPLDAGTYGYYDDFHRSTTTGKIIAK